MVDRRERWNLQNGKGKDRQPQCYIHHKRQRLGRNVERQTQGHVGLYDWPFESSRQPGNREKTRRNISLEFRRDLELDERGGVCLGGCFSPKEIKVAPDRDAASEGDLKRLETRIGRLHPSLILAVLNPCVVYLQLPLGRYDIVGAETFVKQISEDAKFPIITGIINQGRFWEHTFQAQMVGEEPDDTTAGGDYRIRIERATDAEHAKDFIFLERETEKGFPRYIEIVAVDVILEKEAWIDLDTRARMIVHHIFQSQQCVHGLEVIGQTIIGSIEIKPLVFDACPEIPLPGNEEAMSIAKIIV